jgi:hypothetical protein
MFFFPFLWLGGDVDGGGKKPRQYAFTYGDIESVRKEIEECFGYKEIRGLQEGMRVFEENHPTRMFLFYIDL